MMDGNLINNKKLKSMKNNHLTILSMEEMISYNGGGDKPSTRTNFAYDVAYSVGVFCKGLWTFCKEAVKYQQSLPHYHKK